MATSQTEIESQAIELSAEALKTFCEDISGIFGASAQCKQRQAVAETVTALEERFKKLAAVFFVKAEGALEGTLQLILDREGLFTLAGVILSMPEQKILENREHGSLEDAQGMSDVIGQAGDLMASAWQRVFDEKLDGQGHFVKTNTFIGDPWDKPEEKIGLAGDEKLLFVSYEITIEPYSAFKCSVIFPETIFAGTSISVPEKTAPAEEEAEQKAETETEEKAEAETEEKADKEAEEKAEIEAEGKAEVETEGKAETETQGKGSDADEGVAKEEAEASAGDKDTAPDANTGDDVAQGQVTAPDRSEESATGGVSETIQKMTQSSAVLPGESAHISLATSAKDIMQKDVVWCSPDDSVQHALTKMQQHSDAYLLVGRDGVLEGIVSKSNITGAISPYLRPVFAKWRRPLDDATLNIRVKWIMSRPVRTIKPETPLAVIIENMLQFGCRCLPVVNNESKLEGLVTVFDILKALNKGPNISSEGKTLQSHPLT
jgi:CBS domain-containing protein